MGCWGQGLWTGLWVLGGTRSLCSQGPAYSRSQARSDSETSSLPFSVASLTRNYTMQEFALQYFRKPQTL